jgi:membrane associated rhomboid family serine protease
VFGPPLTGADWTAAGSLALYRELRDSPASRLRRMWEQPPVPWATALIVGLLVRIHLWVRGDARVVAESLLIKDDAAITERGEWWRLLGYGLLHGDIGHLLMNGLFLAWTGAALETALGPAAVLTLFAASVLGGGLLSTLLGDGATVGASGADFGFLAAAVIFGFRHDELIPARQRPLYGGAMLAYLAWGLVNGLTNEKVDNLAHLGGAVAGGLIALSLRPALPEWHSRNARALAIGGTLVVAAVVGLLAMPMRMAAVEEDGMETVRPADWGVGWAPVGDRGWASPLGDAYVVARTDHLDEGRADARASMDAIVARYVATDAGAAFTEPRADTRDGVPGWRTEGRWARDGKVRRSVVAVYGRGEYLHTLLVDLSADAVRREDLPQRVIDAAHLGPLAAATESDGLPDTARGKVQRARVAAKVGNDAEALRLVRAARAAEPADPLVVLTELELVALLERPSLAAAARAALTAMPADSRVVAAAARALADAGEPDAAREVLTRALAERPDDRTLARAARALAPAP